MLLNSLPFLYFFTVVLALYSVLTHRAQNILLLVASYIFYAAWDWRCLGLLFLTTLVDYFAGCLLQGVSAARSRRRIVFASLAFNLGVLALFKYADFFQQSFQAGLGKLGVTVSPLALTFVLPAGISFYTFQSLSYVVDVYRGRTKPETNLFDYGLFVAFFPHLVAGPIMRAKNLLTQIQTPRSLSAKNLEEGLCLLLLGYYKKTVVADNLAPFVKRLAQPAALSGGELLLGGYAACFFLYADFAGYSDIARGLSKFLGFDLPLNFRRPVFAKNPADFWRRWHITLSDWFRDYVFRPMSAVHFGPRKPWLLLWAVLTLALAGLWHGAAWHFVVFGLYHGVLVGLYGLLKPTVRRVFQPLPEWIKAAVAPVFFFHLICIGALIFLLTDVTQGRQFLQGLLHGEYSAAAIPTLSTLLAFVGPLLVFEGWQEQRGQDFVIRQTPAAARIGFYAGLLAMILLSGDTATHAFVYFQF